MNAVVMHATEVPIVRASFSWDRGDEKEEVKGTIFERLDAEKARVPDVCSLIGRQQWGRIVDRQCGLHSPPTHFRVASRAYYKLREIMESCILSPGERSVHICEAPGGFVQAAWMRSSSSRSWTWRAVSLPGPPFPDIECLPVHCGEFKNGNVLEEDCLPLLAEDRLATLVTADGATEMDHSHIEESHYPLLIAQTKLGLCCLQEGGDMVIKFYEGGTRNTLRWIAWLTTLFRGGVSVIKPTSSRPTNSELYLIGRDFSGSSDDTNSVRPDQIHLSRDWENQTRRIMESFAENQTQKLKHTISLALRNGVRSQVPAGSIVP